MAPREGVSLRHQPASTERVHLGYPKDDIAAFTAPTGTSRQPSVERGLQG